MLRSCAFEALSLVLRWPVSDTQGTSSPKCISINICDYVIEDARTRNKSLIGLFNQISAFEFPARHPRFVFVASLVDGRGQTPLIVEIGPEEGPPSVRVEGGVEWSNPLAVVDLVFDINGIVFTAPGPHFARICTPDGAILGERRFLVNLIPPPQAGRE